MPPASARPAVAEHGARPARSPRTARPLRPAARGSLPLRILACLSIAAPAVVLRVTGAEPAPVIGMITFGAAIVAAAFLLAWAAEAARRDISGALAIALLALIAVLPEYAVDLYYAVRSGTDPEYLHFAAANMTGSNRLLLGLGWPLVVLLALGVARRRARGSGATAPRSLGLDAGHRMDIGVLALLAVAAFAIPLLGSIPLWFGALLVLVFAAYLWKASRAEQDEEDIVGVAARIAALPTRRRRLTVIALFLVSAGVILACAEPFAESLVAAGSTLGLDSYLLVQWLAPLASEAPEFLIAAMFALRGHGAAAIGMLIAAKVNQWSLLVGSLPIAHLIGGGGTALALDARQVEEFTLTATQTVLGVVMILALRFHGLSAAALAALFVLQFLVTDTDGRYVLSAVHAALALAIAWRHRHHLVPTVTAPFRRAIPAGTGGRVNA